MTADLVILSPDTVGPLMAGPGIRYLEMARALAADLEVVLVAPDDSTPEPGWPFRFQRYGERSAVHEAIAAAPVTLVQGDVLTRFPEARRLARHLAVDLYDPFLFESLRQQSGRALPLQRGWHQAVLDLLLDLLLAGDFFVCASERQRDLWLGMLAAAGRLAPEVYAADPGLRRLIDVVPFGLWRGGGQDEPLPEEIMPGVGRDDTIIYWGGGVWDWLDPVTLVRAVATLAPGMPRLRLVFAGTRRPNRAAETETAVLRQTFTLSDELGLTGRHVFFNDWVPYAERRRFLRAASIGAVLDQPSPETRFAYRTRVLDHVWAALPTLITEGSVTADLVRDYGIGTVIPPGDAGAAARAIAALLEDPPPAERFERALTDLEWSRVVEPLRRYCRNPWATAATRVTPDGRATGQRPRAAVSLAYQGWLMLRESGPRRTLRALVTYLRLRSRRHHTEPR